MEEWKGNNHVFRTYVKGASSGDGKSPAKGQKLKGQKTVLSFDEAEQSDSFGGLLQEGVIDISFDSDELSSKFWDMAEANNWNCLILENPANGHIHSYWKKPDVWEEKDGRDKKLAVGLIADVHSGDTYIPLRVKGVDRFPPSFEPDTLQEVPEELFPVNTQIDLLNLEEGQGRNDSFFRYILILQGVGFEAGLIRRILQNTNSFVISEPLSEQELDTITREEAFEKPVFFSGKTFLHDTFGQYLIREHHIKRFNGQLHCYRDGIYISGSKYIENLMLKTIPRIKSNQRAEVLKYLEVMIPDDEDVQTEEKLIAFKNGVLNLVTMELLPFSPDYMVTNKIPWDYNPSSYSELMDKTLNRISCDDMDIRHLLEECAGYCLYRKNDLETSFILTGIGANGKSTYLESLECMLGKNNVSNLDIAELDDRFSTVMMSGKLANIGDDISDEFLNGKTIATFKKIVSSNTIKAERKGQDGFFFKPYTKLLFSANNIPRMGSKGLTAVKRRLSIIPFNATFSKNDPDYDATLKWKLKTQEPMEYLIQLAIQGLMRALAGGFTEPSKVKSELEQFEKDNNPVLGWLESMKEDEESDVVKDYIAKTPVNEMYISYDTYCVQNGFRATSNAEFSKQLQKKYNLVTKRQTVSGKKYTFLKTA